MEYKRKRYLVNWKFQLKFSLMLILPVLILGIIIILVISNISKSVIITQRQQLMTQIASLEQSSDELEKIPLERKLSVNLKNNVRNLKTFSHDLMNINSFTLRQLNGIVVNSILIFTIGLLLFGIFYSHRIAGPIYRIEHALKNMADDFKMPLFKSRSTDEFREFFSRLDGLRKHILEDKAKNEQVIERILLILKEIQEKSVPGAQEAIEKLKQEVANLKQT